MTCAIPREFIKCGICLSASTHKCCCECVDGSAFAPDYSKICKWCWNKVASGDNICEDHRKSHNENSWPGCLRNDNEMPRTCASCKHKTERVLRGHRITTTQSCGLGLIFGSENSICERYEARFEKLSVNRVVVKMEDYLL